MMKETLTVALIGCGAISGNHVGAILAAGEHLVALCDVKKDAALALREKFALTDAAIYTDWREMLQKENPDVVHICTPHYLHAEMCVEALKQNRSVLCEKPLCISLAQLKQILAAEKKSRGQLGVCLQNRYEPNQLLLKELAEKSGCKGASATVIWRRDAEYYASGDWRGTKAYEGGGVAINQAIHTLDLLQWICGMPSTVTAHAFNDHLKGVIDVEDTVTALFETADGKRLSFFATTAGAKDFTPELSVRLLSGETVLCRNDLFVVGETSAKLTPKRPMLGGKLVWGKGHEALIKDFYQHLKSGKHFPIDGEEGGKSVRLVLGIYRSKGKPVTL